MLLNPNNPRDFARIVHHLSSQRWGDLVFALSGKTFDDILPGITFDFDDAFCKMIALLGDDADQTPVFPLLRGIFENLGWLSSTFAGYMFDTFFNSRNAGKRLSFLVARYIAKYYRDGDFTYDTDAPFNLVSLGTLVFALVDQMEKEYGDNLMHIAEAYFGSEYNPIENYSMLETRTPDLTEGYTGNTATDVNTTSESDGDVFGFNSSTAVPSSHAKTTTDTTGESEKNEGTYTKTNTGTETLERTGNIGVTTSQQMLTSELELRKYDFLVHVCKCFERVMFRQVYSCA